MLEEPDALGVGDLGDPRDLVGARGPRIELLQELPRGLQITSLLLRHRLVDRGIVVALKHTTRGGAEPARGQRVARRALQLEHGLDGSNRLERLPISGVKVALACPEAVLQVAQPFHGASIPAHVTCCASRR